MGQDGGFPRNSEVFLGVCLRFSQFFSKVFPDMFLGFSEILVSLVLFL